MWWKQQFWKLPNRNSSFITHLAAFYDCFLLKHLSFTTYSSDLQINTLTDKKELAKNSVHILHPYCTPKTLTQTPVYTCIYTKAQPKSLNKSISSLDWFFSVAARMEHPNMSEWMSEPNASNKADVSQGCQCQICHRQRVARRRRGAQPWNCSKFRP